MTKNGNIYNIGIIGIGLLGTAILETFNDYNKVKTIKTANIEQTAQIVKTTKTILNLYPYDKYKNIGKFEDILATNILFICLPTKYSTTDKKYNITEITNIFTDLSKANYNGVILLKSTVEPKTTETLYRNNNNLQIIHNPEFLSAKTAKNDFIHQTHIILGILPDTKDENILYIVKFYNIIFNAQVFNVDVFNNTGCDSKTNTNTNTSNINHIDESRPIISICSTTESESVKLFCNAFYATKIQFFTEIKLLCDKMGVNYDNVRNIMILNRWINPMHTIVLGDDSEISVDGQYLPKDIKALNSFMNQYNTPHEVI
jgi:UDP-glucose 6-dehydrogenase